MIKKNHGIYSKKKLLNKKHMFCLELVIHREALI